MAHYAFLDDKNIVTEVIIGKDENELIDGLTPEQWYGQFRKQKCLRTSYNGNIRKRFAGVGYYYDELLDAFIPPKSFDSWIFDETELLWVAPEPYPNDGESYVWNEEIGDWVNGETL